MATKLVYANRINLAGLYSPNALEMTWSEETESYWDSEGNFDVQTTGFNTSAEGSWISFASHSRQEVEAWTWGILSAMQILSRWSQAPFGGAPPAMKIVA